MGTVFTGGQDLSGPWTASPTVWWLVALSTSSWPTQNASKELASIPACNEWLIQVGRLEEGVKELGYKLTSEVYSFEGHAPLIVVTGRHHWVSFSFHPKLGSLWSLLTPSSPSLWLLISHRLFLRHSFPSFPQSSVPSFFSHLASYSHFLEILPKIFQLVNCSPTPSDSLSPVIHSSFQLES